MLFFSTQRITTAILLLTSPCPVYGLPESHDTASTGYFPDCAFGCTEKLIETEYLTGACPSRIDVECFCRTNTQEGYTFGEGVSVCMLAFCPKDVISELGSAAYSICDGMAGAAPKTHLVLSATVMQEGSSPTAVIQTGGSAESTTTRPETFTTLPITTFQSPVGTGTESAVSATVTSSNETASSTSTPAPGRDDSNSMSAGSVVGVSVVSGLSGFFLVSVAIFFYRRKMKSKRKEAKDRDDFEIGGVMSEPPDFGSIPPRRPTPKPPSKPANRNPETSRLMSPFKPRPRSPNPAVVVTGADDYDHVEDGRRNMEGPEPGWIGRALSPDLDVEDSPRTFSTSQRTLFDLPDKPHDGLYPEPLRWARHKFSRPNSETTTFEEDVAGPRSLHGPSNGYPNFPGLIGPRPYTNRRLMPGLPANPRAMMNGFGPRNIFPPKRSQDNLTKPVYLNPEPSQPSVEEAQRGDQSNSQSQSSDSDDHVDYWQDSDGSSRLTAGQPSSSDGNRFYRPATQSRENLDTEDTQRGPEFHRTSRHSGFIKPLSPVREVRTPTRNISSTSLDRIGYFNGSPPMRYPQIPLSASTTPGPAREIVSRPRIVRQHDIKRVEIRRGKPPQQEEEQPKEMNTPYSPDDYWPESSRCSASLNGSCASATPATSSRLSNRFSYPVDKTITRKPVKRESPLEHSLSPLRRGRDLILRVDNIGR